MNKTIKRTLIIVPAVIIVLFAALLILPYAFRGKIVEFAKKEVNKMLDARVDFGKISLSFIRDFPQASVGVSNVVITGQDEFEQDTLLSVKDVRIVMNIKSLFSDEGYEINEIRIDEADVFAHVLADGKANWDIMKTSAAAEDEEASDGETSGIRLQLKDFTIREANVNYVDEEGRMSASILGLNHHTSGDLSLSVSMLKTQTSIRSVSLSMDGIEYVSKAEAELNVDIDADLDNMRFAFSKNHSRINAIPFSFDGWITVLDEGFDMDIKLLADEVDFKSILSMIPAVYSSGFEGLKADGDVHLNAWLKGQMIGDSFPAFDIKLGVAGGWMQYPGLPKALKSINITAEAGSPGGSLDKVEVNVPRFSFNLGGNLFSAAFKLSTPLSDPDFSASANGRLDLGMIKDFYPLDGSINLSGTLAANLNAGGRMSYYEKEQYDKFRFKGSLAVDKMLVSTTAFPHEINIHQAQLNFNDKFADLPVFRMNIGRNDLALTGRLENYLAFVLYGRNIKGQLALNSGYFNVSDFMSGETVEDEETGGEVPVSIIEIPKNIDFNMQARFKELVYDKMHFTSAKGALQVQNGEVKIQNMGMDAFGGSMTLNGVYSTADKTKPKMNMDLRINEVEFTQIFSQVGIMQQLAPIFEKASGRFSTNLSLSTLLKNDMSPDLNTFNASGKLTTKSVGLSDVPVLTALAKSLNRPELESASLKNLNISFRINDGKIYTEPFDMQISNVKINLGGSTALDKSLDYTGKIQLPDNLNLGRFSTAAFKIGGTFTSPKISVDVQDIVSDVVDDAKKQLQSEIEKKADEAKQKLDAELEKRRAQAVKSAKEQAERLQEEARKAGSKLTEAARRQGDELINKANNAIAKRAAEAAAKKLLDEAQHAADELNKKAKTEGDKLIKEAEKVMSDK